ncbi:MAG: hypothetical protein A3A94_02560 [Candidatus Portnoybacteria bacterium RIFCSPLOWO2_01_FULL_43_11]|uniref:DUF5667 domain-containing protein n=4 Tax=Candidatus Portnoyibacteriota TaxID=1817913 RepID=A0A1G2FCD2_9BACT|nr:MAG: hypothetical protein A2815_00740 [Candidatus Portnoybacteria bacterium RIFCSPHIGHO2_01_FULL_40_12b]OGZ38681.1 MAG: hypothetical protein A3A94_02560 [Candidatus Portnoybacteria bacterium RIFCSPLOWO2_01_FULL_43_11]OGZ39260.1 MAG: hypothetical protein A3E90_01100 [Candidatus Portnoybacteria bacterium RIFCSPHIGHO2_12_FULL_40_11]OGZ41050.1 MAG: hypothetical protein A3I20_01240 [Candidatus Portnoybacteria bacterium RIFCSPLOWO2_02_FULL_40_15]
MLQEELIQKIKRLKEIKPSEERLDLMRQNLIKQITFESIKSAFLKPASLEPAPRIDFFNWLRPFQPIALTICLILILGGGPWLVSMASQASLPGETLYPVKQATEKIRAGLASEESKAQLQVEFAERRLEELNKITEDSLSPEKKVEKVEEVINDFKDNLAGASLYVKNTPREKVMAMAKKTQRIKENLIKTREEIPSLSEVVQGKVLEAEKIMEEINYQILTTLIKDGKDDDKNTASTTDKEVLIFLEENSFKTITTTDEIIKNLENLEGQE